MKFTQPVMLQSFDGEFDLPEGMASNTPVIPGSVMSEGEAENHAGAGLQTQLWKGVGKLLHMMCWSRPTMKK